MFVFVCVRCLCDLMLVKRCTDVTVDVRPAGARCTGHWWPAVYLVLPLTLLLLPWLRSPGAKTWKVFLFSIPSLVHVFMFKLFFFLLLFDVSLVSYIFVSVLNECFISEL